jgi:two-component system, cell cycle sensor histidine kinase and response regulator CckA
MASNTMQPRDENVAHRPVQGAAEGFSRADSNHAQKMEALGRLAGGVAHDFNNLLTVISGYIELSLQRAGSDQRLRDYLVEARRAAASAAVLTNGLLAFCRRPAFAPGPLDLNEVVAGVQNMLRRLVGETIEFVSRPAEALGAVRFDKAQAEQLLVNLVINARDAMPHGGSIVIETANVRIEELHPSGLQPGEYVLLTVSDTGEGMTPEVRARAFEPFFTTKAEGDGTGLGLAMVAGAVARFGGAIDLQSERGLGTSVRIFLPRVEKGVPVPSSRDGLP